MQYIIKKVITAGFVMGMFAIAMPAFAAAPSVNTLPTNQSGAITQTTADIQGFVTNLNGSASVVRNFRYMASASATPPSNLATGGNNINVSGLQSTTGIFGTTIAGLSPNTKYWFMACAADSADLSLLGCGQAYSFTSLASAPPATCTINSFTANPSSISAGGSSTLSWTTTNCGSASISNLGTVATSGNISTGAVSASTTYILTVSGASNSDSRSATVTVVNQQQQNRCAISAFTASPTTVVAGGASYLSWTTTNCSSVTMGGLTGTYQANYGTSTGALYNTVTYTLNAFGPNNTNDSRTVTVTVTPATQTPQNICTINSFTANPTSVSYGAMSNLSWSTSNCNTSVSISGLGTVAASGSQNTYSLTAGTTFTLSATGTNGSDSRSIFIAVSGQQQQTNNACVINSFYATPSTITAGNTAYLAWSTNNCSYVTISGLTGTYQANYGTSTGALYNTMTYTLNAAGTNGTAAQSLTVYVNGTYNNNQNYNQYCTINSFYPSQTSVSSGGSTYLSWNTNNCSSVSISGGNVGNYYGVNASSVPTNTIYGTTTYTLTAYGQNTVSAQTTVWVGNNNNYNYTNNNSLSVVTTTGTVTTATSARLNGLMVASGGYNTTGWFEYGTTTAFGQTTEVLSLGSGSNVGFWSTVSNLSPETTYYYRAVAQNGTATMRGDMVTIRTGTATAATTTAPAVSSAPAQGTGNSTSLVALTITSRTDNICPADGTDATIHYENLSGKTISNAIIRIALPKDIAFKSSTSGVWSETDHTLTVTLPALPAKASGDILLVGVLSKTSSSLLVTTATMSFSNPKTGAQENAIAYGMLHPGECGGSSLAGLAFFSGTFLPQTLMGWMIIAILVMIGMLVVRKTYSKKPQPQEAAHH